MQQKPRSDYPKYFRKNRKRVPTIELYLYLKGIIVISINIYLTCNFLCDFIHYNTRSAFHPKFWSSCDYSTPQQAMPAKIIAMSSLKVSTLYANFLQFHAIESERELSKYFGKIKIAVRPFSCMYPNCMFVFTNDIYLAYKIICSFILQKLRSAYPKNSIKSVNTAPQIERFSPKVYRHKFVLR